MIYVPPFGHRFLKVKDIKPFKFILNAQQRRNLILLLSRNDDDTFKKYVTVFQNKPIESEYRLWLYFINRSNYSNVQQWFEHEMENNNE